MQDIPTLITVLVESAGGEGPTGAKPSAKTPFPR